MDPDELISMDTELELGDQAEEWAGYSFQFGYRLDVGDTQAGLCRGRGTSRSQARRLGESLGERDLGRSHSLRDPLLTRRWRSDS